MPGCAVLEACQEPPRSREDRKSLLGVVIFPPSPPSSLIIPSSNLKKRIDCYLDIFHVQRLEKCAQNVTITIQFLIVFIEIRKVKDWIGNLLIIPKYINYTTYSNVKFIRLKTVSPKLFYISETIYNIIYLTKIHRENPHWKI